MRSCTGYDVQTSAARTKRKNVHFNPWAEAAIKPSITVSMLRRRVCFKPVSDRNKRDECRHTASLPRNSKGRQAIILSISICGSKMNSCHKEKPKRTPTPRSFFSFAVIFGFPAFFLAGIPDLLDETPVAMVMLAAKVVSASVTVVLSAVAANCKSRALASFRACRASIAATASCSITYISENE